MKRKVVPGIMLTLLLIGLLTSAFNPATAGVNGTTDEREVSTKPLPTHNSPSTSSAPPCTQWNRTYGGTSADGAHSVVQTRGRVYAIAGYTASFGAGSTDFWLVKTDSAGNMQWNQTYGGTLEDCGVSLVQTFDRGYAIAGYTNSFGAGMYDFWLVKTDPAGTMQWNQTYGGTSNEQASSLVQTSDGGYAIAGFTNSFGAGSCDFWLVKTDPAGNMQWNQTYGGTDPEGCSGATTYCSLVQTSDGGYAIAGDTLSFDIGRGDFYLIKADATGNMEWNKTYGGAREEVADSLVQTADGGYAMLGYTVFSGDVTHRDFWLVKTDSAGNMQWNQTYGGALDDWGYSLVQTVDWGYTMAGLTSSLGAGSYDSWLVKTDWAGNMEWNQTYGGTHEEWGYSLIQTVDGGYTIAGRTNSFGAGSYDFWLVRAPPVSDLDGDGLFDCWEINGIDYNSDDVIDLVLPGANPLYKDLYVEIDYMGSDGTHDHNPDPNAVEDVISAFRNAPVINPNGTDGIALHIEVDEAIPHQNVIKVWDDYDNIKSSNFGTATQRGDPNSVNILAAKKYIYRYGLFIHQWSWWDGTSWVTKTSSGVAECPGNDFIVSLGAYTNNRGTRDHQSGTLMHELGHTLGLWHGGGDGINGKPNYLSVMSYTRVFSWPIAGRPLDYSRAKLPSLNESNLDENLGIQGPADGQTVYAVYDPATGNQGFVVDSDKAIDWNTDCDATDIGVARSINDYRYWGFGDDDLQVLDGYDDWANILYPFFDSPNFNEGVHVNVIKDEITWEMAQLMSHNVAVICSIPSKTVVGEGYSLNINVTVANQGGDIETFNVTAYANTTAIQTLNVTNLPLGNSTTITFKWNTTGFAKGVYTISATATTVPGEMYTVDNTYTDGIVTVSIPGDVNGDRTVDFWDLVKVAVRYGSEKGKPPPPNTQPYEPNADINCDEIIDLFDIVIIGIHYGETDP